MNQAASGTGIDRDAFAIRRCLKRAKTSMAGVARKIELSPQLVQQTVNGARNNHKVLRYLLYVIECPPSILGLPKGLVNEFNKLKGKI
ncbi:hypothetical protein [Desulfovibrio sp. JC010]|uniref:hypothetical protein n=1 Tax=Desulfovibrio sp. JC010 TaxID=2593641 RepID=UPI0013D7C4E8|nr:hypothetical protein [Desulfovibrio sp. JC010]NDV27750.1 hypothetical protein [Desulfovibrio sp. JC010]